MFAQSIFAIKGNAMISGVSSSSKHLFDDWQGSRFCFGKGRYSREKERESSSQSDCEFTWNSAKADAAARWFPAFCAQIYIEFDLTLCF